MAIVDMKSNITVFIDIDDVLCLNSKFSGWDILNIYAREGEVQPDSPLVAHPIWKEIFLPEAVRNLRQLHDEFHEMHGIQYVISSSWRTELTLRNFHDLFWRTGLDFVGKNLAEPEWSTPNHRSRLRDIEGWLKEYGAGQAVLVIDDTASGTGLERSHMDRARKVVLCDKNVGFVEKQCKRAVDLLRCQLQKK